MFAAVSLFGSIAFVDVAVRVLRLGPPAYAARRIEPGMPLAGVRSGGLESFNYRPNVTFWSIYDTTGDMRGYFQPDGKIEYRINSSGIRGAEVTAAKPSGGWRVVCLGDSFTFGEGVREEDTYPVRLEALLVGRVPGKRVQVINAGVQGQGTVDELNWFRIGPWQFQPDVVTLGFVLNDVTPRQETMRHHTEWTEHFQLSWLGRVSKLTEWVERVRWSRGQEREFLETTRSSFASPEWEACKRALADFADESRRRQFRFVVVIFPVLTQLNASYPFGDIHALVKSACMERKIECIDLLDDFRGQPHESLWVHPTDQHPNERAHAIAARRIGERLLNPVTVN